MKSILLAVTILVASGGAMATPLDAATATKTYEAIPYGSGPDGGYSFDGCTTFDTPFSNRGCKFDGPGTDGYLTKPTTLRADGLHPVLHWNSFDYLALSYMSNSSDIFVAAYDASTDLFVQGWKFAGARYISARPRLPSSCSASAWQGWRSGVGKQRSTTC